MKKNKHRIMLSLPMPLKKAIDEHIASQTIDTPVTYFILRAVAEKIQREKKEGTL